MRIRRPWLLLAGLLLAAPALWAAAHQVRSEMLLDVVERAARAHESVSYAGSASWRMARWGRSVQVRHDAGSGRTSYRWQGGFGFTMGEPSARTPDPAAFCPDAGALERNYGVEELGNTRFLDRTARLFVLRPRHAGRPTVKLTLDAETLLPLQVVTFRADGSLYRVAAYREIEFAPQEVADRPSPGPAPWLGLRVPLESLAAEAGFSTLEPEYLPPGFACIEARVAGRVVRRARTRYSDGVTVFEIEQNVVPTPAQMESEHERWMGPRGAQRFVSGYLDRRLRTLASAGGEEARGKTVVRHREWRKHRWYELRTGGLEIRLTARDDLEHEEVLRILRSLPAP